MFIGHYAPAAALKPLTPKVPLWHLFVAVQFLDYLWSVLIIAGVEKARIVPGFLEASDLDLYFMPYTHSLAAAIFWSLLGAAAYRLIVNPAPSCRAPSLSASRFSATGLATCWCMRKIWRCGRVPTSSSGSACGRR